MLAFEKCQPLAHGLAEVEKVGESWTKGTSLGRSRKRKGRRMRRREEKRTTTRTMTMRRRRRRKLVQVEKGEMGMEYQCERKEEWFLVRREEKGM